MAQVNFGSINKKNQGQLKCINAVTLPVKYSEQFYINLVSTHTKYSWFAYLNDLTVGAITCREEFIDGAKYGHVMTCTVLPAYQRLQIGTQLLNHLEDTLRKDPEIKGIHMHVWTSNTAAFEFYKRQGLEVLKVEEGYYKDLDPPDSYVLRKFFS
jgi:ribosomal protein S18 acetylase RimI-like enzyme